MKPKVTVITCVYNRAHLFNRVVDSMKNQTYRQLQHIIVDDGSTDNIDEIVDKYKNSVEYDVLYIKKKNGGKHTATNVALNYVNGEYILNLDSDDELMPNAIELLVDSWQLIPQDKLHDYWCVHGRCRNQFKDQMLGKPYPKNINQLSKRKAEKISSKTGGEKVGLMKSSILKNYRYPEDNRVNFVTEDVVWIQIKKLYRTFYTNNIVRIYYVNEGDCLSKPKFSQQTCINKTFYSKWYILNRKKYKLGIKKYLKNILRYSLLIEYCGKEYLIDNKYFINKKDIVSFFVQVLIFIPCLIVRKIKFSKIKIN